MKETIENKLADIVEAICKKDPRAITRDEYEILSAELIRVSKKTKEGKQNV